METARTSVQADHAWEGPAAPKLPSQPAPTQVPRGAATCCFVTTAPRRAHQAPPGLLAQQPLQTKTHNQKSGLPLSLLRLTDGRGKTENSHSEGAFPPGCCVCCDWGRQGARGAGIRFRAGCRGRALLLAEPGSGSDRRGHIAHGGNCRGALIAGLGNAAVPQSTFLASEAIDASSTQSL